VFPEAGDHFQVTDEAKARHVVEFRQSKQRDAALRASAGSRITLDQLHEQVEGRGSERASDRDQGRRAGFGGGPGRNAAEACDDQVKLKIINAGVGDGHWKTTSFSHLPREPSSSRSACARIARLRTLRSRRKVDIRTHNIIYEVSDEIKKAMEGLLEPVFQETYVGRAEVRNTFRIKGLGHGGRLLCCGRRDQARLADSRSARWRRVIYTSKLSSLKRFKDDASEVRTGS